MLRPETLLGDRLLPVVSVSVAVILFEGGLSLRIADLPWVGGVVRNLLSVGAVVTWLIQRCCRWRRQELRSKVDTRWGRK